MTLFIFVFAVAMVLTVTSLSPSNMRHYPNYHSRVTDSKNSNMYNSAHTDTGERPLMTLIYTIIFVGALLVAMYALA